MLLELEHKKIKYQQYIDVIFIETHNVHAHVNKHKNESIILNG